MILFASVFWDPNPEVFTIPFIHLPILWYGLFFAVGFMVGFPIFVSILERYFLQRPEPHVDLYRNNLKNREFGKEAPQNFDSERATIAGRQGASENQNFEEKLTQSKTDSSGCFGIHRLAVQITDRLTVYMVIATVLGARIGHYLFYEKPSDYFHNLSELFSIWRMRGLSSHGAAIGIVLGVGLFAYRNKAKLRGLTWLHLLDFVCVPTALAGAFIRVGNFFNQEILGTPSQMPWAVVFGHAADGSYPVPRHPVQLYEAFAYAAVFLILWRLTFLAKFLREKGMLLGVFLVLVFGFRFVVEYWKEEQSQIMPSLFSLTMGQLLSLPAVLVGVYLLVRQSPRK